MKRSDKKRLRAGTVNVVTADRRVRFSDPSLKADASGTGARWNMLFPRGTFHRSDFPSGAITFDDKYFATIISNWAKRGKPKLATDYHHRGPSDVEVPNSEKIASGLFVDFEPRADGLWALWEPTAAARAKVNAGELLYFSPDWFPNGTDVATGLKQGPTLCGAGLLIDPFFQEMPRVAAADVDVPLAQPKPEAQEQVMNREQLNAMLKAAGISLAATASDDEARSALSKYVEESVKAAAIITESLKAKATAAANEEALKAQLTAEKGETATLKASLTALTADVTAMKAEKFSAGVKALQAALVSDGRIVAASQESVKTYAEKMGLDEATKFFTALPKVVSMGELGHGEPVESDDAKAVKASAETKVKAGMGSAAALRAAALENTNVVKQLASTSSTTPPKN